MLEGEREEGTGRGGREGGREGPVATHPGEQWLCEKQWKSASAEASEWDIGRKSGRWCTFQGQQGADMVTWQSPGTVFFPTGLGTAAF